MEYLKQVASVKLTGAKLIRADALVQARKNEDAANGETPDFITTMVALMQAVPDEFTRVEVPAIVFRMQALNALLSSGELRGWAQQNRGDAGAWFVNEAVLEAAATAALDLSGKEPAFHPEDFKSLTLNASDTDGEA